MAILDTKQLLTKTFDTTSGGLVTRESFFKEVATITTNQSIALSGTYTPARISVFDYSEMVVQVKVAYNAHAIAGVTVRAFASLDSTYYDTDAYGIFGPDLLAGSARTKTRKIDVRGLDSVELQLTNNDSTFAATVNLLKYAIVKG